MDDKTKKYTMEIPNYKEENIMIKSFVHESTSLNILVQ